MIDFSRLSLGKIEELEGVLILSRRRIAIQGIQQSAQPTPNLLEIHSDILDIKALKIVEQELKNLNLGEVLEKHGY